VAHRGAAQETKLEARRKKKRAKGKLLGGKKGEGQAFLSTSYRGMRTTCMAVPGRGGKRIPWWEKKEEDLSNSNPASGVGKEKRKEGGEEEKLKETCGSCQAIKRKKNIQRTRWLREKR